MKRSRAALTLFLAMFAAALQTVGLANVDKAAVGDARSVCELRRPHDCYAEATRAAHSEYALDDYGYRDSFEYQDDYGYDSGNDWSGDACHPQRPCQQQAYAPWRGFDRHDPCLQAQSAHERPAYPIEEYVYGNAAGRHDGGGYNDACDEWDCCHEASWRIHREDLTDLAGDARHSTGCELVLKLNADNDGLTATTARQPSDLPPGERGIGRTAVAPISYGYDYDDNYHRGWDFDCALEDSRRGAYLDDSDEYLCDDLPGCWQAGRRHSAVAVAEGDEEPADLPPAESGHTGSAASSNNYRSYDYEYDYGYSDDASSVPSNSYRRGYGYDEEQSTVATDVPSSGADRAKFNANYWDDELSWTGSDLPPGEFLRDELPPGESIVDDMPPAESLTDDLPPAESRGNYSAVQWSYEDDLWTTTLGDLPPGEDHRDDMPPAETVVDDMPPAEKLHWGNYSADPYDSESYGDYSECDYLHRQHCNPGQDCHKRQPRAEPPVVDAYDDYGDDGYGYRYEDEYRSYTDYRDADNLRSAGMSDDEPSRASHAADVDALRPLVRSTSWLLGTMGQALIDLSKTVDELVAPEAAAEAAVAPTAEPDTYSPWPSTLGRQPGVDCPLEL